MTWLGGIDEAGYGAIIGPLAHGAAACSNDFDWKTEFDKKNLIIGDSKKLYSGGKGLSRIENAVLLAARISGWDGDTINSLLSYLSPELSSQPLPSCFDVSKHSLPCFSNEPLPSVNYCSFGKEFSLSAMLTFPKEFNSMLLRMNKSDLTISRVFLLMNDMVEKFGSKGKIIVDKQGGRNFYSGYLYGNFGGLLIDTICEGKEVSRYLTGELEVEFRMKADDVSPLVSLASMLAKYLRELFMFRFKQYWKELKPNIKPTAGYPEDAKRFISDISRNSSGKIDDFSLILRDK